GASSAGAHDPSCRSSDPVRHHPTPAVRREGSPGPSVAVVQRQSMIPRLQRRIYSAGHFLFRLDDNGDDGAAYLKSAGGGMVKGAVLEEQAGPASQQFKHIGSVEMDLIEIEIGMALSRPVLDCIKCSWEKNFTRQNGCIIHADFNLKCKMEQWFY